LFTRKECGKRICEPQSIDCCAIAARTSSSERHTVDVCAVAAAVAECAADDAALTADCGGRRRTCFSRM
jgi:hypothetical protein